MRYKKTIATCSIATIISLVYQFYPNEIRTSKAGLEIIGNAEGCYRDPYKCPADVLTVGIGSTEAGGEPIVRNKTYTDKEIAERWVSRRNVVLIDGLMATICHKVHLMQRHLLHLMSVVGK